MSKILMITFLMFSSMANADAVHIILDPGHGGPEDTGFMSTGFNENLANLQIAKKIQMELEKTDEFEVVLTRIGDYPATDRDRKKTGNQYGSSIFISLHSSTYENEPSIATYILKQPKGSQNSVLIPVEFVHGAQYKKSLKLAQIFDKEIPENFNHEIIMSEFLLEPLVGIKYPAALVECRCVSEKQPSVTEANLDEFARNLASGIKGFISKELQ